MPRFRKKPVEVVAERIPEATTIDTLEGPMRAKAGDWLITGVRGEKYSCDDEIFRETYEAVDEQARAALADREAVTMPGRGRMDGDKAGAGPGGKCICPKCGATVEHDRATPCNKRRCPKCGATMTRAEEGGVLKSVRGRPLLVPAWFRDALQKAAQQLSLFDEQAHPRHGKGSEKGGQFAPKGGAKQGGGRAEAKPPRRKRSQGDTQSALAAAVHNARLDGTTKYVYGVYRGSFGGVEGVFDEPPPFKRQHYRVTPDGNVELVKPEYDNAPKGITDPDEAREYILRTLAENPEGMDPYDLGKPVDQSTWEDVYEPMFDDGTLAYDEDSDTVRLANNGAPPGKPDKPPAGTKSAIPKILRAIKDAAVHQGATAAGLESIEHKGEFIEIERPVVEAALRSLEDEGKITNIDGRYWPLGRVRKSLIVAFRGGGARG